jgi:pilus assembly protein CpaC
MKMNTRKLWAGRAGGDAIGTGLRKPLRLASSAVLALAVSLCGFSALAERAGAADAPAVAASQVQDITLTVGHSVVIPAPWPVARVSVTDPKIADVLVLTPKQVRVSGLAVGTTDVAMWSKDEEMWQARVDVQIDLTAIKKELGKLFPATNLELRQARDMLVVCGTLSRAEQAEQLHRFLNIYGVKYVDMTSLAGVQQVQIKVVVAEANRTSIRALGVNAILGGSSALGASLIGADGGGPLGFGSTNLGPPSGGGAGMTATTATLNPAVTLFGALPSARLAVAIQALAENQYARILAEPTLTALSGQEASFLAGGEFPIPIVQGGGGTASNTSVTIEYKEFGVKLRFRPTVLGDGTIRLHVAPEVSELSNGVGSVTISGFSIPAINTRRAETTLELGSGQTFAMAGLMNQLVAARASKVPGLGDIPVLGALFRSVRYQRGDTELVVLVTPTLVEPLSMANQPPLPGILHMAPNDWELYAMGYIDGKIPPKVNPIDSQYLQGTGLTRLRGPGAWAAYDSPAAPSSAPLQSPAGAATQDAPKQ